MKTYDLTDPMNLSTMLDELTAITVAQYRTTDNTTDEYADSMRRNNELVLALRRFHGIKMTQEFNTRTGSQALHMIASSEQAGILRDEWITR